MMKHTFKCDEHMLISIPLGALKDGQEGELMPDQFLCVFRDVYKVFINKGKPKRVGVAQAIVGLFVLSLGLFPYLRSDFHRTVNPWTFVNILFMVSGMLTYATGHCPNMYVAKLSFICNIISFFWSLAAIILSYSYDTLGGNLHGNVLQGNVTVEHGVHGLIVALLGVEMLLTLFSIYWFSRCPVIKLQA